MSASLTQLAETTARQFAERFGREASSIVAAPGRVNLLGGHVDYNDGIVLPLAIDRYTVIAGDVNQATRVNLLSASMQPPTAGFNLQETIDPEPDSWSNYVAGVLAGFRSLGHAIPGFDAVIGSDVPIGSGLSSSAALEVATATFLECLLEVQLTPKQKALLCQKAERDFAGVPCGVMDQLTSVVGQAGTLVKIDCRSLDVELIPWSSSEVSILILNTHASHQLADGEYALRRRQCRSALQKLDVPSYRDVNMDLLVSQRTGLDQQEFRRARHIVTEWQRCQQALPAIHHQDWTRLGQQLFQSHQSLRDDFEVSCDELDLLVDEAARIGPDGGVFGMRMTGGGFGGCTVALVDLYQLDTVVEVISLAFERRFQRRPTAILTRPSRGAHVLRQNA